MQTKLLIGAAAVLAIVPPSFGQVDSYSDPNKIKINWSFDSTKITVTATCQGTGWCAVGFNTVPDTMAGTDIIVGGVPSDSPSYIWDMKASSNSAPAKDATQNVKLLSATETSGATTVSFERDINTGDSFDAKLTDVKFLLWALHTTSDNVGSKHTARGYVAVDFKSSIASIGGLSTNTTVVTTSPSTSTLPQSTTGETTTPSQGVTTTTKSGEGSGAGTGGGSQPTPSVPTDSSSADSLRVGTAVLVFSVVLFVAASLL